MGTVGQVAGTVLGGTVGDGVEVVAKAYKVLSDEPMYTDPSAPIDGDENAIKPPVA